MNNYTLKSRDGQPYNFEDGLSVKGFDLSGAEGTKAINVQLPGESQLRTLYDWLLDALTQLNTAQQTLPFATNAEAVGGIVTTKLISPATLKVVLSQLIGSVPPELDTMTEFVSAISGDPNLATTIQSLAAQKVSLSGAAMTGLVTAPTPPDASNKAKLVNIEYLLSAIDTALLTLKPVPTAPALSGATFGVIGVDYALNMSATAAPDMTVASFDVSLNGAAAVNVPATDGAAVYHWMVLGAEGGSMIFTVVAKDNRGRSGPSATHSINLTQAAVNTPTVVSPADNAVGVSPMLTITTSKLSMKVGTDTHASTDWRIVETSTGTVAAESLADASHLTSWPIDALVLKNDTQYTVTFSYLSTSGYRSLSGTGHFVTRSALSGVVITGATNHVPGTPYTFTLAAAVPPTSNALVQFYYSVDPSLAPIACGDTVTLTADQLTVVGGNFAVHAWAYWDLDGLSTMASKTVQELTVTPGTFLFPVNNATGIPVLPTFLVSAYSSNAPGDVHLSSTWTLTDLNTNTLQTSMQSTVNKTSWAPTTELFPGVRYRIECLQYGSTIATPVAVPPIEFVVTNAADVKLPTRVIQSLYPTAGNQFGMGLTIMPSTDRIMVGSPGADYQGVVDVGMAEIYSVNDSVYMTVERPAAVDMSYQAAMHIAAAYGMDAFDAAPQASPEASSSAGAYVRHPGGPHWFAGSVGIQGGQPRPISIAINSVASEVYLGYKAGVATWAEFAATNETQNEITTAGIPTDPLGLGMTLTGFAECLSANNGQLFVSLRWGNETQSLTGFALYTKPPGPWNGTGPNDWTLSKVKYSSTPMGAWTLPVDQPNACWMGQSTGSFVVLGRPCAAAGGTARGEVELWLFQETTLDYVKVQTLRDTRGEAIDNAYFGMIVKPSASGHVIAVASYNYAAGNNQATADLLLSNATGDLSSFHQAGYSFIPSGTAGASHNAMTMALGQDGKRLFIGNPNHTGTVTGGAVYYYDLSALPGVAERNLFNLLV